MGRFDGRVAIVTGGAQGIGRAVTERLISEGCKVSIFDVNEAQLAKAQEELGASVSTIKVDVSNEDSVIQGFAHTIEKFGKVDIAVNAAGIVGPNGVKTETLSVDDFDKVFQVNTRGSFLMTKHALKAMLPNNYGRILMIASIAGKEGNAGMCAYSTSKAAVIGLVKAAGKEYAETGITINALAPAVVRTGMVDAMQPEQVKYMTDKIPMKRCAQLTEVASLVSWIVSEEASFNTAFCFDLTGGRAVY